MDDSLARQAKRLIDRGRTPDALALLERSLAEGEDERTVLNLTGYAHFRSGDLAAAEAAFRRLVARPDASARDQYNLGSVLERRDKRDEAKVWYGAAAAADPSFGRALERLTGRASASKPLKEFDIPRDEEELEEYKRLSRARARVDLMTEIWYRLPWPVRIFQLVLLTLFVAIWAWVIAGAASTF